MSVDDFLTWEGKFILDFSMRRLWKDHVIALFSDCWAHKCPCVQKFCSSTLPFQGSLDIDFHLLLGQAVRIKEVRFVMRPMERAGGCRGSRPLSGGLW